MSDIPCLVDSSAVRGVFSELDSAIVIHFGHCVWTLVLGFSMFTVLCEANHDFFADREVVVDTGSIFGFVVLENALLLAFSDVFPIGLERDIEHGVAAEQQL